MGEVVFVGRFVEDLQDFLEEITRKWFFFYVMLRTVLNKYPLITDQDFRKEGFAMELRTASSPKDVKHYTYQDFDDMDAVSNRELM